MLSEMKVIESNLKNVNSFVAVSAAYQIPVDGEQSSIGKTF